MKCFRLLLEHLAWIKHQFLRPALLKSGQKHFHSNNTAIHNSIIVIDYLSKMSIKTVPQPPYCPDVAPCDFWLFPKLRGCRYGTIGEMKEAMTKVIDTLPFEVISSGCNAVVVLFQQLLEGPMEVLLCERVNDLHHSLFHLLNCLIARLIRFLLAPSPYPAQKTESM